MKIQELLELPFVEAVTWLIENRKDYTLEEIKEPCEYCESAGAYFCPQCGRETEI